MPTAPTDPPTPALPAPGFSERAPAGSGAPPWAKALTWLLAAAFAALYVLTRGRYHLWDAIAYVARITDHPLLADRFLSTELYHPHHLLYVPFGKLVHGLAGLAGGCEDPFLPMQLVSALAGAGSAALIASLIGLRRNRHGVALLALIGLGFSASFWGYSASVEVMLPAIFCGALSAWLLARRPGVFGVVLAGLAAAAAALFHQIMALPVATTAATLVLAGPQVGRPRRDGWLLAAVSGGLAALAYLAVAVLHEGLHTPSEILHWLFAASSRNHFQSEAVASTFQEAWVACRSSLLYAAESAGDSWQAGGLPRIALLAAALLALTGLASAVSLLRAAAKLDPVAMGLGAAILSVSAFITWFQAGVPDYWVYLAPLLWPAFALYLPRALATSRAAFAVGLLAVAAIGASNYRSAIEPRLDPNHAPYAPMLHFARTHFRAGDVLVAHGPTLGRARIAIMYCCDVDVLAVPDDADTEAVQDFDERLAHHLTRVESDEARLFVAPSARKRIAAVVPEDTTYTRVGKAPRVVFRMQLP